jgi:hypothetical protein
MTGNKKAGKQISLDDKVKIQNGGTEVDFNKIQHVE